MNLRKGHPRDVPAVTNIYPGLLTKTIFSVGTAIRNIFFWSVLVQAPLIISLLGEKGLKNRLLANEIERFKVSYYKCEETNNHSSFLSLMHIQARTTTGCDRTKS